MDDINRRSSGHQANCFEAVQHLQDSYEILCKDTECQPLKVNQID